MSGKDEVYDLTIIGADPAGFLRPAVCDRQPVDHEA